MTAALLAKLARYERPERVLPYARALDDETRAAIFGTDVAGYDGAMEELAAQRDSAVAELAADPDVRSNLARWPGGAGAQVVAIGESTTADRLSWFEILAALVGGQRPDLSPRFENLAVSGSTTTQAVAGLPALRRFEPDLVFCMLGANDAQRFGGPGGDRLVSADETARNLRRLRIAWRGAGAPRWVWLAPTPVDEAAISAHPYLGGAGLSWTNDDVRRTARLIAELAEPGDLVIDPADAAGMLSLDGDGLHPTPEAQIAVVRLVLARLANQS
ncbi:SGNH/GDSL hydrolase family protein [Agromyces laixinhei]|uniref:SGNH/GDSL hydrolase family protein n=1 Tax=Agromyces laixinhei TaxID=2585717 RepID=UPI0012ECC612|nr:SGNH/GDSL hydrolase family protein [Agromyces laixinhei]